jgi:hypothetical protein
MAMLDPKNPPEFAHPLSGRRSCSLAKVAREGKIPPRDRLNRVASRPSRFAPMGDAYALKRSFTA